MKNNYTQPTAQIIRLETADILMTSGASGLKAFEGSTVSADDVPTFSWLDK
jgi:hypothetical protein